MKAAARQGPLHVGVIGLGAGTIATYANAADSYIFYEINPNVITSLTLNSATCQTLAREAPKSMSFSGTLGCPWSENSHSNSISSPSTPSPATLSLCTS